MLDIGHPHPPSYVLSMEGLAVRRACDACRHGARRHTNTLKVPSSHCHCLAFDFFDFDVSQKIHDSNLQQKRIGESVSEAGICIFYAIYTNQSDIRLWCQYSMHDHDCHDMSYDMS